MTESQSRITLANLPPRARQLTGSEMSAVFGGCVLYGGTCDGKAYTCCSGQCVSSGAVGSALGAMVSTSSVCR
jgi:hypothetical protein